MALLPPFFIDSLVAFEQGPDDAGSYKAVASGVLVGFDTQQVDDAGEKLYKIGLVTARHVVEEAQSVWVKFNKAERAERYAVDLTDSDGAPLWRSHEEFDVAVLPIAAKVLKDEGAEFGFMTEDKVVADLAKMKELGVFAGDDVFVLGFPMGLAGTDKKYAIVRGGVVARLDDELIA